jgi:diadenosine tetraphosphate (Ap4A) HIT family hydrolase
MTTLIHARVEEARAGTNTAVVCRVPSGWVVLADDQFLSGYCILLPDPVVGDLNDLDEAGRAQYLTDMARVGDALLAVTGAYRINYAIMGNSEPALHAHIVPRFLSEPDLNRRNLPWSYPPEFISARKFDPALDGELLKKIAEKLSAVSFQPSAKD